MRLFCFRTHLSDGIFRHNTLILAFLLSNKQSVKNGLLTDGVTTCKVKRLHNVTSEDITHVPDTDHVITLVVLRENDIELYQERANVTRILNHNM